MKPYIAVLLNITPDHLDRYNYDFEQYAAAKFRISQAQTKEDYFIYNIFSDEITNNQLLEKVQSQKIPIFVADHVGEVIRTHTLHNAHNNAHAGGFADLESIEVNPEGLLVHIYEFPFTEVVPIIIESPLHIVLLLPT